MRVPIALFATAFPLLTSPLLAQSALPAHRSHGNIAHARGTPVRAEAPLSPEEQAAQVVDRFTFGATPGMVQAVAAQGWEQWFSTQLQPGSIPNPALDKRLQNYPSLAMPPSALAVEFPDGQVIRRIAEGKLAMPADPQLAGAYQVMLARYQEKQEKDRAAASVAASPAAPAGTQGQPPQGGSQNGLQAQPQQAQAQNPAQNQQARQPAQNQPQQQNQAQQSQNQAQQQAQQQIDATQKAAEQARAAILAGSILTMPAPARLNAVLALPVLDRMALTRGLKEPLRTQMLAGVSPHDRELLTMMGGGYGGNGVAAAEMEQAKVLRAVISQRQLQEVMTDFWVNHFNIDLGKSGDEILYANQFEQQAIRPHALGKFRDLLLATAESPAMMIYLDNHTSIGPDSPAAGRQKKAARGGLNENYGREVMELHTVGVDGGYTQADVTALANILTGWTVQQPQQGGPFAFEPHRHEPGTKQWLGHSVKENGQQEGIEALNYLASAPATARHISFELAQRFVADTPPPALVDRMVAAWTASDGDIAQVLQAMVHSPEFFARANYRNKVKTPLEFVASALRATDTDPANPGVLTNQLRAMGEPLYRCLPPTGYPNTGDRWMNSAALVDRLNFALNLSEGKLGGMHLDAPLLVTTGLMAQPEETSPAPRAHAVSLTTQESQGRVDSGDDRALALLEHALVSGEVSSQTNSVIHAQLAQRDASADAAAPTAALDAMVAMILGSPEFQVH